MSYKFNQLCLKFSLVLGFVLLLQGVYAQYDFNSIAVITGNKKGPTAGNASVVIWKDSSILYKKDTGSMKLGKTDAQQSIGAASRWLTAALVMSFVDEGKISLDDPVGDYLPIFNSYSKGYITIRHCLANTTGIESGSITKMLQKKKFASLEEQVNYYAGHNDIVNNPGKDFFFGNSGINIAARVLEVVSKRKTFDRLIQEKILRPLGMRKTTFVAESGAIDPAAGGISTSSDYIRFLAMLLNNGVLGGKRILTEESVAEMHKMQISPEMIKFMPPGFTGSSYGLGVFLQEGAVISNPSFTGSYFFIDSCRKYACVIMIPPVKGEPKKDDLYKQVKDIIDASITCN